MNIEEFIKYYFPHLQPEETKYHQELLETLKPGRQITLWGRIRGDDWLKYQFSLSHTAITLMEGKTVILVGKNTFADRIISDLKEIFKIDVISNPQKMGVLLKAVLPAK